MKTIYLPCYGIEITLSEDGGGTIFSDSKEKCPCCGSPECGFDCAESQAKDSPETEDEARCRIEFNRIIDGIESLTLAAACAGIDVETPAFIQAIETAVEAAANNV